MCVLRSSIPNLYPFIYMLSKTPLHLTLNSITIPFVGVLNCLAQTLRPNTMYTTHQITKYSLDACGAPCSYMLGKDSMAVLYWTKIYLQTINTQFIRERNPIAHLDRLSRKQNHFRSLKYVLDLGLCYAKVKTVVTMASAKSCITKFHNTQYFRMAFESSRWLSLAPDLHHFSRHLEINLTSIMHVGEFWCNIIHMYFFNRKIITCSLVSSRG